MFHLSTVEPKTYKLLKEIFCIADIRKNFALAGGTSLALQIGHRTSIDLDIFSPTKFSVKNLENQLTAYNKFEFQFAGSNSTMLFSNINKIKTDFVFEPSKLLHPIIVEDGINYFHVEDIAAMKLHTICGRGKKKDFFDVYALIKIYGWKKLLQFFEMKYGESQFVFLWRSILYFEDANEDPDIIGFQPYNIEWDEIKEFIIKSCR